MSNNRVSGLFALPGGSQCLFLSTIVSNTDYESLIKPFFWEIGRINLRVFGVFLTKLSAPNFGTVSPLSMISIIQFFNKNLFRPNPNIPKI